MEYSVVIALVVVGIIVTGPYVVRSWNAYLKGEEDAVRDSFSDPLLWTNTNNIIPDCGCEFVPPCETPPCCGYDICSQFQDTLVKVCDPLDCEEDETQCEFNVECCSDWEPIGCGVNSGDANCHPGSSTYGEMGYWRECGDGEIQYQCLPDDSCIFACGGDVPNCGEPCGGDNEGLPNNSQCWNAKNSCGSPKCEYTCKDDYVKSGGGCGSTCACPPGTSPVGGGTCYCQCSPNEVYQGDCPTDHCERGSCPANHCRR